MKQLFRRMAECLDCERLVPFIAEERTDVASIDALENGGWTNVRNSGEMIHWSAGSEKVFGDELFRGSCEECSGTWPPRD